MPKSIKVHSTQKQNNMAGINCQKFQTTSTVVLNACMERRPYKNTKSFWDITRRKINVCQEPLTRASALFKTGGV